MLDAFVVVDQNALIRSTDRDDVFQHGAVRFGDVGASERKLIHGSSLGTAATTVDRPANSNATALIS